MSLAKRVRLNRLFAHPSGRLCSAPVDHSVSYTAPGVWEFLPIRRTLPAFNYVIRDGMRACEALGAAGPPGAKNSTA